MTLPAARSDRRSPTWRSTVFGVPAVLAVALTPGHASASLSDMVLPPSSVPRGFERTVFRSYTPSQIAIQGTWKPEQLRRWGYQAGQEAQYDRDADSGRDPAQLSSDAGMYRAARGAREAIAANRNACDNAPWTLINVGRIGTQTYACRQRGIVRGRKAEVYFVVWRCGRYKGAITLTGPRGRFTVNNAEVLARRQANRMPC